MHKTGLMIAPLLWLAACSQSEEAAETPEPSFSPSAPEPAPAVQANAAPAESGAIPAAYLGAWDWTGGPCDGLSELQLTISPTRISFYESVGTVRAVREDGGEIAIDLAMEGEGETWQETITWRLVENATLLESDHTDPSGEGPLRYKRCPAAEE